MRKTWCSWNYSLDWNRSINFLRKWSRNIECFAYLMWHMVFKILFIVFSTNAQSFNDSNSYSSIQTLCIAQKRSSFSTTHAVNSSQMFLLQTFNFLSHWFMNAIGRTTISIIMILLFQTVWTSRHCDSNYLDSNNERCRFGLIHNLKIYNFCFFKIIIHFKMQMNRGSSARNFQFCQMNKMLSFKGSFKLLNKCGFLNVNSNRRNIR